MTHSRLKQALIKQNASLVTFPEMKERMSHDGGFKIVRFGTMSLPQEIKKESKGFKELAVAYSAQISKITDTKALRFAVKAQELLFIKKVPIDFVLPCLYSSANGNQITLKGACDLLQFSTINKGRLNIEKIREIVGMICLGVYDLHSRSISHRDIKNNNFFVYSVGADTTPIIMLGDLDTIVEVNTNGNPISDFIQLSITQLCPFEMMLASEAFLFAFTESDFEAYKKAKIDFCKLNFKAIDCYALGCVIGNLLNDLLDKNNLLDLQKNVGALSNFLALVKGLKDVLDIDRLTIDDVLKHVFFGEIEQERVEFFTKLREKAQKNTLKINGETFSRRSVDDASFVALDLSVRKTYQNTWRLADLIEEAPRSLVPVNGYSQLLAHITFVAWIQKEAEKLKSQTVSADIRDAVTDDLGELFNSDKLLLKAKHLAEEAKPYAISDVQLKQEFEEMQAQLQELRHEREKKEFDELFSGFSLTDISIFDSGLETAKTAEDEVNPRKAQSLSPI